MNILFQLCNKTHRSVNGGSPVPMEKGSCRLKRLLWERGEKKNQKDPLLVLQTKVALDCGHMLQFS